MNKTKFEVIIVGGGPAGMSAALILGRSRIKTLVLNSEKPRNKVAKSSNGFLTQDGTDPKKIFYIAKNELQKYPSVIYKKEEATELKGLPSGFIISTNNDSYISKRVIIASGYKDDIFSFNIPGLKEVYGRSVFPCPFCDGFELANKKLAVIGDGITAPIFAKLIAHWSKDLIVFTNGEEVFMEDVADNLTLNGIKIIDEKIKEILSKDGMMQSIELEDGRLIERVGGFMPGTKATDHSKFAKQLNIAKVSHHKGGESYKVDFNFETDVKGLFIIGDARTSWSGVSASVAEGSEVGKAITKQIVEENWLY